MFTIDLHCYVMYFRAVRTERLALRFHIMLTVSSGMKWKSYRQHKVGRKQFYETVPGMFEMSSTRKPCFLVWKGSATSILLVYCDVETSFKKSGKIGTFRGSLDSFITEIQGKMNKIHAYHNSYNKV